MVLSRFWTLIIACSIIYIFYMLAAGRIYTITNVVNGAQNDPVLLTEYPAGNLQQTDTAFYSALLRRSSLAKRGVHRAANRSNVPT